MTAGPRGSEGRPRDDDATPPGALFWEESFRSHEQGWFFGEEPSNLARRLDHFLRLLEIPPRGRLLELGCGEGRDVVFFARLGFTVVAMDGAPTAVARTGERIRAAGLGARVEQADLVDYPIREDYDVIFANNSFQFAGAIAPRLIHAIRGRTRPGGINAVAMFTREEIEWRARPDLYCLEPRELKFLYADWQLLEYCENVTFHPKRDHHLSFAHVIARRPGGVVDPDTR